MTDKQAYLRNNLILIVNSLRAVNISIVAPVNSVRLLVVNKIRFWRSQKRGLAPR